MEHLWYNRELSLLLSDRNLWVELKSLARFHISRWSPEFFFFQASGDNSDNTVKSDNIDNSNNGDNSDNGDSSDNSKKSATVSNVVRF